MSISGQKKLHVVIPAAGLGRRMRGGDKHLELVGGVPLLARLVAACAGLEVLVTVPSLTHPRAAVAVGAALGAVDPALGLSASLRVAALWAEGGAGLMVLPGDMPEIGAAEVVAVVSAFRAAPDRPARGMAGAQPGHPVIFPPRLFPALAALEGDGGARAVLRPEVVTEVALPGLAAVTDLDTPEDWAVWRAQCRNR